MNTLEQLKGILKEKGRDYIRGYEGFRLFKICMLLAKIGEVPWKDVEELAQSFKEHDLLLEQRLEIYIQAIKNGSWESVLDLCLPTCFPST